MSEHQPPEPARSRARALDRYPLNRGKVPDDLRPPQDDGADALRRRYRMFVALTQVQQDASTRAFTLTEDEADAWTADVADALTTGRQIDGMVWFIDSDGDRITVPARAVAFTNLSVDTGAEADEDQAEPDNPAEHPAARDLANMWDGMDEFLNQDQSESGEQPRGEG